MPLWDSLLSISPLLLIIGCIIAILQVIFLISIGLLFLRQSQIRKQLALFFGGKEARDLEKILTEQLQEVRLLDQEVQEVFDAVNKLRDLSLKTIHKVSVERFNPFKEVGGNQSFCVALLDGRNTGVVISSLHTREGTRVYAKPVKEGQPKEFPFTDEEKEAVIRAMHSHTSQSK
jgi:hypothetical protein